MNRLLLLIPAVLLLCSCQKPPVNPLLVDVPPTNASIHYTAYYVAEISKDDAHDAGRHVEFEKLDGSRVRVKLDPAVWRTAELEGSAVIQRPDGSQVGAYRLDSGKWKALPPGVLAKGNRVNPLAPYRHVAADQSRYPYGSLIHFPTAVGRPLPDGSLHDGWLWVADVGGAIRGNHFDLFVGSHENYQRFLKADKEDRYPTTIYLPPKVPDDLNPETPQSLSNLLARLGHLKEAGTNDAALEDALRRFQKSVPHIPKEEHGFRTGAATLWYLKQHAALLAAASAE